MSIKIGIITATDRGSKGEYDYLTGERVMEVLKEFILSEFETIHKVVPDEQIELESALIELSDHEECAMIITAGGTGPAPRDVTPEATMAVCQKMLPGFGELMRSHSMQYVKTGFLSRQTAGIRNNTLIINMPGKPRSIRQCMEVIAIGIPHTLVLLGHEKIELIKNNIEDPHK
ncbi:MAG: molybdopterin adenylyltransferase [Bacteroidia bacterium]